MIDCFAIIVWMSWRPTEQKESWKQTEGENRALKFACRVEKNNWMSSKKQEILEKT